MKRYESPELVELGDAVELTLGGRPGEVLDCAGAEYEINPCLKRPVCTFSDKVHNHRRENVRPVYIDVYN